MLKSNLDLSDRLSEAAGSYARQATIALAMAAACEEALDDGGHSENQLYFLARTMCHEHGLNYNAIIHAAREAVKSYDF